MGNSFSARLTFGILKLINFKKLVTKLAKGSLKRSKSFTPKKIKTKYQFTEVKIKGKALVTFSKKDSSSGKHIIYLHGGAYLFEASSGHWNLVEKILDACNCRITTIDYPLAPENNYIDVYEMLDLSYDILVKEHPEDEFILMGDSAGGGLAMGFCQKLIEEDHFKKASKCVLISPWLDLTMSNTEAADFIERDYLLTMDLLLYAADLFADGDDPQQYLLSPINGNTSKMPPTLVLYASEELFKPDCLKLQRQTDSNASSFSFIEFEGMQHAWPVFPIPEQDQAVEQIASFL
jgi:acetyl esterase/lipase